MKTIKTTITFDKKASRVELLVRLVYWIPLLLVVWILGLVAAAAQVLQLFYILIFGRRNPTINGFLVTYISYIFRINAYYNLTTDERPPIVPER